MIKKTEEGKKPSFKKFSDLNDEKVTNDTDNASLEIEPLTDKDLPCNPNLPQMDKTVQMVDADTKPIKTNGAHKAKSEEDVNPDEKKNEKIEFIGKVAKLPKGARASKAYNFLESIKISKSSIWYLVVEKMDNELQLVKYNYKKGVDLSKFVNELKIYYISKYKNNESVVKLIEAITIDGEEKYSCVKNIPNIELDGRKMITHITEDLIKLLSK